MRILVQVACLVFLCYPCYAQTDSLDRLLFEDLESPVEEDTAQNQPPRPRDLEDNQRIPDASPANSIQSKIAQAVTLLRSGTADESTLQIQQEILLALEALVQDSILNESSASSPAVPKATEPPAHSGDTPGTVTDSVTGPVASSPDPGDPASDVEKAKLLDRAWGHLPAATIKRLKSTGNVEFLPSYRDQIETYFRRLGELRTEAK